MRVRERSAIFRAILVTLDPARRHLYGGNASRHRDGSGRLLGLAGLLLMSAACSDAAIPDAPVPAVRRPELSTDECVISAFNTSDCRVHATVDPFLHQSSLNEPIYTGPITVTFDGPVTQVQISGQGAVWCLGDIGTLVGYDSAGAEVEREPLHMIDPSDCGDDDVTFGGAAMLTTATPLRKVVILPPNPFKFQFTLGQTVFNANTTADYTLLFAPASEPVQIELQSSGGEQTFPGQRPNGNCKAASRLSPSRPYSLHLTRDGVPLANTQVTLTQGFVDPGRSGHVNHTGTPPLGSFAATSDLPQTTVTTDADGRATFQYFTGEFSSRYYVRAEAEGAMAKDDTFEVGVTIPALPSTPDWETFGGGRDLHPDVWNATPRQAAYVLALAREFHATFGKVLPLNDMSLPKGGRFDVHGWNDTDHCSHRWGNTADVHSKGFMTDRETNWVKLWWKQHTGHIAVFHNVGLGEHFHLQIAPEVF